MKKEKNYGCGLVLGFLTAAYTGSFFLMKLDNVGLGIMLSVIYCSLLLIAFRETTVYQRR